MQRSKNPALLMAWWSGQDWCLFLNFPRLLSVNYFIKTKRWCTIVVACSDHNPKEGPTSC
jgi:hypothetical protein